jgi:hypothetical protein
MIKTRTCGGATTSWGHTSRRQRQFRLNVRFGSKADIRTAQSIVRFIPEGDRNNSGHRDHGGQSTFALPRSFKSRLLRNAEGIIHVDAEIPDGALYLGVTEQKLHGSQIPGAAVDERRFSAPQ